MTQLASASKENMTTTPLPSDIIILIVGHLEPEACYSFIQAFHGLDKILPAKEFRRQATRSGNTIIHLAARRGDLRLIQSLHSRGLDVNIKNRHGVTPLAAAARRGHRSLAEFLISIGATIDSQDKRRLTPLHNAAYHGADDIVRILLEAGADPCLEANYLGTTALHWACKSGHVSTVALFLSRRKNLDEIPAAWESVLGTAAKKGRTALVKLLIDANFVISDGVIQQAGGSGQGKIVKIVLAHRKQFREGLLEHTLLQAIWGGCSSTVEVLIEHGLRIGSNDRAAELLGQAGSIKSLRAVLQAGIEISETKRGIMVLAAATTGKTAMVEYLAGLGWVTPDIGMKALYAAISGGHATLVKYLLSNGFKLDPKNPKKAERAFAHISYVGPLVHASCVGHLEVLKLFPGSVAPILVLYPAVCNREISLVQELLRSSIDNSSANYSNQKRIYASSLWRAVEDGDTEMVQILLDAGISPEAQRFGGGEASALYRAAQGGFIEIVKLLVLAGADISRENHETPSKVVPGCHGYTALYIATLKGHQDVMKHLIESGASILFQGAEGTPLHAAARSSCPSSITLLLEAGADLSAQAFCGGTPLHYAAERGRLEAVKLLLRAGADPAVRNRKGLSPWDLAMKYGHGDIASVVELADG